MFLGGSIAMGVMAIDYENLIFLTPVVFIGVIGSFFPGSMLLVLFTRRSYFPKVGTMMIKDDHLV